MRVLVLCTGNSCRSQMAEAFLRQFANDDDEVFSAGLDPQGVHPLAIKVMQEKGIDISQNESTHIDQYRDQQFDVALTVCEKVAKACPSFSNADRTLHWPYADPAAATGTEEEVLKEFRRIRDDIEYDIVTWVGH